MHEKAAEVLLNTSAAFFSFFIHKGEDRHILFMFSGCFRQKNGQKIILLADLHQIR